MKLYRVTSPTFVAGLLTHRGQIKRAAPILKHWRGVSIADFQIVAHAFKWTVEAL